MSVKFDHWSKKMVGELSLRKGITKDDLRLVAFDAIHDCNPEVCSIGNICTLKNFWTGRLVKKSESGEVEDWGKCRVIKEYLRCFIEMLYRNYGDELTEPALYRIGMHLVPLYKILCKFKVIEYGLDFEILRQGSRGMNLHPVYKGISEYVKLIDHIWKSEGLRGYEEIDFNEIADRVIKGEKEEDEEDEAD